MNELVIPVSNDSGRAPESIAAVYSSLFPADAVQQRWETLARAGFGAVPATKPQLLASRSLEWGTSVEGALRIFTEPARPDPALLTRADAALAALRVSRGLAEDTRSCADPWVAQLLSAATTVCGTSSSPIAAALAGAARHHQRLAAHDIDFPAYSYGLQFIPLVLLGLLIEEWELLDPDRTAVASNLAGSLGVLNQIADDLRAVESPGDRGVHRVYRFHDLRADAASGPTPIEYTAEGRSLLRALVSTHARTLLEATEQIGRMYPASPSLDEVLLRANLTLRTAAEFLRRSI